jgi:hypothetical protein
MLHATVRFAASLVLATLASAPLAAQRIWVVDQTNGLGTHFTELPPAVQAARDGDVLRVRRGYYDLPQVITKAITILGENEPLLVGMAFHSIASLRYDQSVVIRRCRVMGLLSGLQVVGCQGRVHFDQVTLGSVAFDAVSVVDCRAVTFNQCTLVGQTASGLAVGGGSAVLLSQCTLTGHDVQTPLDLPAPALVVRDASLVLLSSSTVTGGSCLYPQRPPASGVLLESGRLELAGAAMASVAAGQGTAGNLQSAITTRGGSVLRDPRVRLLPFGPTAVPISGPAAVAVSPVASLMASATGAGGSIQTVLVGTPGELAILLIGPATQPLRVSPFGNLMIDPRRIYFANVGVVGPSGFAFQNFPIAASATPGEAIAIQPLTGPGINLRLQLPVVVTID